MLGRSVKACVDGNPSSRSMDSQPFSTQEIPRNIQGPREMSRDNRPTIGHEKKSTVHERLS